MNDVYLSAPTQEDLPVFVKYLNDPQIYQFTLKFHYPYTEEDGRAFLADVNAREKEWGRRMDWAIRRESGELMGMIGFHGKYPKETAKDEIGFWLARRYWGRGIILRVLDRLVRFGFEDYGYQSFELPIFSENSASIDVAERCGFRYVKWIRKVFQRDGQWMEAILYVKKKEGIEGKRSKRKKRS